MEIMVWKVLTDTLCIEGWNSDFYFRPAPNFCVNINVIPNSVAFCTTTVWGGQWNNIISALKCSNQRLRNPVHTNNNIKKHQRQASRRDFPVIIVSHITFSTTSSSSKRSIVAFNSTQKPKRKEDGWVVAPAASIALLRMRACVIYRRMVDKLFSDEYMQMSTTLTAVWSVCS